MGKKLRIGFIGCGGIANQKHFPALMKCTDLCEIVAFCDLIEARAVEACAKYGTPDAKVYTDYHELLKDASIDVVHVCTPNVSHSQITVDSFEAGKNVMCEKPMSHSYTEAKRMMDAWKKSGKQFTIGYQNRFRPDTQALHCCCEQGGLGEIYYARAHATRRKAVPTWGVFPDKEKQGGGPLIDIGTHALDITLWMMDNYEPECVMGSVFQKLKDKPMGNTFGPWEPESYEVEDSAFGMIRMKNGATIYLEASWALNISNPMEAATTLCGTEAGAELVPAAMGRDYRLKINSAKYGHLVNEEVELGGGGVAFFDGGTGGNPEDIEARQWLNAILTGGEPLVKPEEALVVTRILEAIYRSAETGKMVTFDD